MGRIEKGLTALEGLLDWLGRAALFAMMLLVVADVTGRYLLNDPVPGVYEITEFYLMISVVFLGLATTQREGGNVRVDIVLRRLPERMQRGLEIVFLVATIAVFSVIAYAAGRAAAQNFAFNRWTTGVVPLPTGPSWSLAAIGSGALSLRLALQAVGISRGRRHTQDRSK